MPNKYFRYITSCVILLARIEGFAKSSTFPNDSIARPRREIDTKYLAFPQGSNVQLVYCLTMSTYSKPRGVFTVVVTAALAWELPYRNTVPYGERAEVYHRRSRRELYRKVELMLKTQQKNGKACVLKAICKAAGRRREDIGRGSFVEEMIHILFTLPGGWYDIDPMTEYERAYQLGENCDEVHAKCPGVF